MTFKEIIESLTRKKKKEDPVESPLLRCLSTLDLTALGIGSTLGVGVYVLAGAVAKTSAGPAVIVSFAIAALASIIAGLCYAEFGARVPRAGSVYIYAYVTMGEFIAFLIGWTLILEYVIGSASVVRGLSSYINTLTNDTINKAFRDNMPMNQPHLSPYPDFLAFSITIVFSIALALGVKQSTKTTTIFTMVNVAVVLFVIIAGSIKADINNWNLKPNCTEDYCPYGTGGFMPYGISGVITGAAICFYGFIGFDCISTTGEEAKDPRKSIPIAIVASLIIVFLAYLGVSSVLTTALPYYEQNSNEPFPHMFKYLGWDWGLYIVSVGAACGLCASLVGAMFPLPRIIYAMSTDGLIFQWLGDISDRFKTPLKGTLTAGILTALLALIFELSQLVHMMSIGTLLAYSIVAACTLILRYEENESTEKTSDDESISTSLVINQLINIKRLKSPTKLTSMMVYYLVALYFIECACSSIIISIYIHSLLNGNVLLIIVFALTLLALIITLILIYLQPTNNNPLIFKVPGVPFLPGLSMLINIYLMMMLDVMTWIRFSTWMLSGLCIYVFYGIRNSKLRKRNSATPG